MLQHCLPLVGRWHRRLKANSGERGRNVWRGCIRGNNIDRDRSNGSIYCSIKMQKDRGREKEKGRMVERPHVSIQHSRKQSSHWRSSNEGERWATVWGLWDASTLREWQQCEHRGCRVTTVYCTTFHLGFSRNHQQLHLTEFNSISRKNGCAHAQVCSFWML